ncbi:unnamed protein product [Lactuca virosa]|uniref:Uncharacterized protein n=1 Tax=Lactuca virosa TaxID=75947 RepID=A0AAU9NVI5_9ASTR|nr:unnamed protein product [Lactuca virosa]
MTPNSDQFTPSMSNQLRAVTLTHVRYRRGDQLGHFLAWISLVPVFISLGGFISHFMFRRELQESKCGSWVLSFGHWQCLRCILGCKKASIVQTLRLMTDLIVVHRC